jgi:sec-independent protein translocase protein TatA
MFGLGIWELLAIFMVVLLLFGAKRLPEIGGSLGKGIREFKDSIREVEGEVKGEIGGPTNDETQSSSTSGSTGSPPA